MPTVQNDGLWYISTDIIFPTISEYKSNKLNMHQKSELWSLRLDNPGTLQLQNITKYTTDLPDRIVPHAFAFHDSI